MCDSFEKVCAVVATTNCHVQGHCHDGNSLWSACFKPVFNVNLPSSFENACHCYCLLSSIFFQFFFDVIPPLLIITSRLLYFRFVVVNIFLILNKLIFGENFPETFFLELDGFLWGVQFKIFKDAEFWDKRWTFSFMSTFKIHFSSSPKPIQFSV